jgi:hypothetical protein
MKYLTIAAILTCAPITAAHAATDTPIAAINQFLDSFNKGDVATAAAAHTDAPVIIDEFAPHLWSGTGALTNWMKDYDTDAKARKITDPAVALGAPDVDKSDGSTAYVVLPSIYTFKQDNIAMRQPAHMAFALTKTNGGWRIAAWTWAGTVPVKAK